MGEEGNAVRIDLIEKHEEARDLKQEKMAEEISSIKIINIRQELYLKAIMWTLRSMLGVFIVFVITNGLMYLNTLLKWRG
jgi:hypothetical protein